MLKHGKLALVACACLFAALFAVACSSGSNTASSADSSSGEEVIEASDPVMEEEVDHSFYALIVGNDSRYGTVESKDLTEDDPSFSDVMILTRVDLDDYRISLVSMPRDVGIDLDGTPEKLNNSYYQGGMDRLVAEIEKLVDVDIEYTFDLGFKTYNDFINAMDGVVVNIPFDMSIGDAINGGTMYLNGGDGQLLDGAEALAFSRMRMQYGAGQESSRQYQNRHVVEWLIEQSLDSGASAEELANTLLTFCKTNMDAQTLTDYVQLFMDNRDKITFQLGSFPHEGALIEELNSWQIPYDEATFNAVVDAMENNTSIQAIVPDPDIVPAE